MKRSLGALFLLAALPAPAAAADVKQDARVADLVHAGKIRIGLHLPQFVKDPATGEIHGSGTGVVVEQIARALAEHMGVELQLIGHSAPPALVKCLEAEACDAGFLGFVPDRTKEVGFTTPYIQVPFTYMVPAGSPIHSVADADKPGIRIAAVTSHASTLALSRILKHAEIVPVDIPDDAFELMRTGRADAWASPRPPLLEYAPRLSGSRVLDDHYGANLQSMAVPRSQVARLDYIDQFLAEAKASGLVQRAIARAGERGMEVAPEEEPIVTGTIPAAKRP